MRHWAISVVQATLRLIIVTSMQNYPIHLSGGTTGREILSAVDVSGISIYLSAMIRYRVDACYFQMYQFPTGFAQSRLKFNVTYIWFTRLLNEGSS